MSDLTEVLYEVKGPVAYITINRPERRNALNPDVIRGLRARLASADATRDVHAVVLTGAGDQAFCAGGDLGGMSGEGKVAQHLERAELGQLFHAMRASRLPIVARVNGHALAGGFGLMLACDLVIASEDAQMGTPEIDRGLWPFMISAVLQRDLPRKVALEMMLTGSRVSAAEAARWGVINQVVPRDSLDETVVSVAEQIAAKSPLIVALGKRSFYRAEDMSFHDALEYLAGMLSVCLESEDTIEGVSAWLQKRKPEWKGR